MKVLLVSSGPCVRVHLARELLSAGHELLEVDLQDLVETTAESKHGATDRPLSLSAALEHQVPDSIVFVNAPTTRELERTPTAGGDVLRILGDALSVATRHRARFVLASLCSRGRAARRQMRAAESLVGAFASTTALPVGVARLEGLYGVSLPDGRDDTLLGALVRGGITRRAVHLPTPWDGWLWPLHVRDAARGVHQLLISQETTPITFAGATPFRMRELVATVERILDAPLSVSVDRLDERRAGAPPPIALARHLLRWRPSVGLFSGLEELARSAGPVGANRGSRPGAA